MKNNLLHTPDGVRDIYNEECARKLNLQEQIRKVFHLYGYKDIQTPTFEFFDIFKKERGSVLSRDMFKFVDRDGDTLVLRPDMTPPICRSVAKYYMDEEMPVRLCYCSNTFINNSSYQGRLKEITQTGAELIGDPSEDADGEMVAMMIDCLRGSGLKDFQIELGHAEFFKGLMEEAGMDEEHEESLRELIANKNNFGVEQLLSELQMSEELKNAFLRLPDLFGGVEKLEEAKAITKNPGSLRAVERLEQVYHMLKLYGLEHYISFDLGMLSKFQYYTGVIIRGYTYGTGEMIVTGGRYDRLMEQFGKDASAVGFVIVMDHLISALERQKISIESGLVNTMILYDSESCELAVPLAGHFRSTGLKIQLLRKTPGRKLEEYKEFAARENIEGILYLDKEGEVIQVINLLENKTDEVKLTEFLKEAGR